MDSLRPPPTARNQGPLLRWAKDLPREGARTLDLNGRNASDKVLDALAAWPGLEEVEHVDLSGNRFTGDALPRILDVVAPRCVTLDLSANPRLREQGFRDLADRPWPKLRRLRIRQTKLRKGLASLEKLDAPELVELDAHDAGFGAVGAIALAKSSVLPQLKVLDLEGGDPGVSGFKALHSVLPDVKLERLAFGRRPMSPEAMEHFLSGPLGDSLRDLAFEVEDPDALKPLAGRALEGLKINGPLFGALPRLPGLRRLRSRYGYGLRVMNPVDEAVLDGLELFEADFCGEPMVRQLAEHPAPRLRFLDFGCGDQWELLGQARWAPQLRGLRLRTGLHAGLPRGLAALLSRATALEILGVGVGVREVLRVASMLPVERLCLSSRTLADLGAAGLGASPLVAAVDRVFTDQDSKIEREVLEVLGDRLRFTSGEPLDALNESGLV